MNSERAKRCREAKRHDFVSQPFCQRPSYRAQRSRTSPLCFLVNVRRAMRRRCSRCAQLKSCMDDDAAYLQAMMPLYSRSNPFPAKMVVNRRLNQGNPSKETRHHEISLAGSGLTFEPGDSMAVYASNDPPLVEEIIRALGATGEEIVPAAKNETAPLRQA